MNGRKHGFTLIELLVVVTIIVVLLALLVPALDKAIYQAELAVCMANQHGIAGGVLAYAAGNKRYYPERQIPRNGWEPFRLSVGGQPAGRLDDRPMLRTFLKLNGHLLCPLTQPVDLDSPGANTNVYATYALWFSWRYTHGQNESGMNRIGDRFTWTEADKRNRFSVISGDWDDIEKANDLMFGTHPSKDGRMHQLSADNAPIFGPGTPSDPAFGDVTYSWWRLDNSYQRGETDLNFAYDDGSVRRFSDTLWDDSRMVPVPDFSNRQSTTLDTDRWLKLPRE